jgi:hypothetical protein
MSHYQSARSVEFQTSNIRLFTRQARRLSNPIPCQRQHRDHSNANYLYRNCGREDRAGIQEVPNQGRRQISDVSPTDHRVSPGGSNPRNLFYHGRWSYTTSMPRSRSQDTVQRFIALRRIYHRRPSHQCRPLVLDRDLVAQHSRVSTFQLRKCKELGEGRRGDESVKKQQQRLASLFSQYMCC